MTLLTKKTNPSSLICDITHKKTKCCAFVSHNCIFQFKEKWSVLHRQKPRFHESNYTTVRGGFSENDVTTCASVKLTSEVQP